MADRFPSIEEFSEGQTEAKGEANFDIDPSSTDPQSFIERERAALGDDADLFAADDSNVLSPNNANVDGDLLGGDGTNAGGEDVTEFESSFPAIDMRNNHMAPGGTITGSQSPFLPGAQSSYAPPEPEEEPEVIKEWRERRQLQIEHHDKVAGEKKAETIETAKSDIDAFYVNYNNKRDKNIDQTRKEAEEFLENRDNTVAGGTSWERIAKLVDLSGKGVKGGASGTGKDKFRELLLSLRKDENAPGAKGV